MHPVAPPSKKQRSSREAPKSRDALTTATDDAIARRRAELRRLEQMQTKQQDGKGLLDQARSQLGGGPPMPPPQHMARTRHSDIFPNVPKVPSPVVDSRKPTPQVARRLDPSFEERTPRSRAKSAPPMRPPPPPAPPQLVAEAPPERTSPITPMLSTTTDPPSTVRRDMLRNLRELADTPPLKESNDIRLVKELKQAQDEKADALRKVARLKEQIQQLQKHEPANLETLVQVAETSGESAAVSWAREQVSGTRPQPISQVRLTLLVAA